ncbi:hypothetical protein UFOVP679_45 [uncultured Caudovirales phage]|uniref:DUF5681 domain-containing protein n=1 Tax=uncultured Caudovirales phage TaxID=2100421 RepID=A0A6J5NDF6_9CAUD|nr:hypothetical protein UFOVP679_45 [uncultured Caudovirales phage]
MSGPETTGEKRKPVPPVEHRFKPGNPGRPKGSRNKLGEAFLEALHDDFNTHGVAAIVQVREEKPDQYLKVIASILPKELNVNVNDTDAMSDDELISRLRRLDDTIRPFLALAGEAGIDGSDRAATAH